jgi:hypothetical protein
MMGISTAFQSHRCIFPVHYSNYHQQATISRTCHRGGAGEHRRRVVRELQRCEFYDEALKVIFT